MIRRICFLSWMTFLFPYTSLAVEDYDDKLRECIQTLKNSDEDNNGKITKDEYVEFLQSYDSIIDASIDNYNDLPLLFQATFNALSCYCPEEVVCCIGENAYWPIYDFNVDINNEEDEESEYMTSICVVTDSAIKQTKEETSFPTRSPTEESSAPTTRTPTAFPTALPSKRPTPIPTPLPSKAPVVTPTMKPSVKPITLSPTRSPSVAPIAQESSNPSSSPIKGPTKFPTPSPILPAYPTPKPTITAPPTLIPSSVEIFVSYFISVPSNVTLETWENSIFPELIAAMDILALETATQISRRRRMTKRNLGEVVQVLTPTDIDEIQKDTKDCPVQLDEEISSCNIVTAAIRVIVRDEEYFDLYIAAIEDNIALGELQKALELVNPNTSIKVLIAVDENDDEIEPVPKPSNTILNWSIAIVAMLVVIAGVTLVVRRRNQHQQDQYESWINSPDKSDSGKFPKPQDLDVLSDDEKGYAMPFLQFQAEGEGIVEPSLDQELQQANEKSGADDDNISYEDSSGWSDAYSESQGGTLESVEEFIPSSPPRTETSSSNEGDSSLKQRLDDLEAAMKFGDWSAVGASAALLAASQDNKASNQLSMPSSSWDEETSGIDKETASKLEEMINVGDWEGVIHAAAKIEASSMQQIQQLQQQGSFSPSSSSNSNASQQLSPDNASSSDGSMPYSVEGSNASSGSVYVDEGGEQPNQIRKQVVELIERVVPEELPNVDEMLAQFKGREHELLETLRTMQERDIALKAKKVNEKKTKLELSDKGEKMKRKVETMEAAAVRAKELQETFQDDDEDIVHQDSSFDSD